MNHTGKHMLHGLLWLLGSEILCLILAFSLAILPDHPAVRIIGLIFGITAHILMIGSCAQRAAAEDVVMYRASKVRTRISKILLIAVILMLPSCITYLVLSANADSVLILNLFPLFNAPFIRIYQFLTGGREPFSAVPSAVRVFMALPPLITGAAYTVGYYSRYLPAVAALDARSNRT